MERLNTQEAMILLVALSVFIFSIYASLSAGMFHTGKGPVFVL